MDVWRTMLDTGFNPVYTKKDADDADALTFWLSGPIETTGSSGPASTCSCGGPTTRRSSSG